MSSPNKYIQDSRPIPSSINPHYQPKCATVLVKICIRMKNYFHIKGSAL